MRTSRRNHRGCLLLVFHGNVVSICSVSWSWLFSVTVLMSHNYSVLKCLCLVLTVSSTDQSETRLGSAPRRGCNGVWKASRWTFEMKTQTNKPTAPGALLKSTACLFVFRFQPTGCFLFPTDISGTVTAALEKALELRDVKITQRSLEISSSFLCVSWWRQSAESYFLASWNGCWPLKHRREVTLIIADTQGHFEKLFLMNTHFCQFVKCK